MLQAEIAVLRFGLGARPGELTAATGDPRAWLMAQIQGPVPPAGNTPLAPSEQIFTAVLAARDERQALKRGTAGPSTVDGKGASASRVTKRSRFPTTIRQNRLSNLAPRCSPKD